MRSTPFVTNFQAGLTRGIALLFAAMRPIEWMKNVFVGAPLFFSGQATDFGKVLLTGLAALAFCAISSAVYLLNDINDRYYDRLHPTKRLRPIASGDLGV